MRRSNNKLSRHNSARIEMRWMHSLQDCFLQTHPLHKPVPLPHRSSRRERIHRSSSVFRLLSIANSDRIELLLRPSHTRLIARPSLLRLKSALYNRVSTMPLSTHPIYHDYTYHRNSDNHSYNIVAPDQREATTKSGKRWALQERIYSRWQMLERATNNNRNSNNESNIENNNRANKHAKHNTSRNVNRSSVSCNTIRLSLLMQQQLKMPRIVLVDLRVHRCLLLPFQSRPLGANPRRSTPSLSAAALTPTIPDRSPATFHPRAAPFSDRRLREHSNSDCSKNSSNNDNHRNNTRSNTNAVAVLHRRAIRPHRWIQPTCTIQICHRRPTKF